MEGVPIDNTLLEGRGAFLETVRQFVEYTGALPSRAELERFYHRTNNPNVPWFLQRCAELPTSRPLDFLNIVQGE